MFFSSKLISIKSGDRVLEVGPGATPHVRSDAFLELDYSSSDAKIAQRGGSELDANFGGRPVYFYAGNTFPFRDNEFDYVICSHVIEHVDDPERFLAELFRVGGGRGYIEYPLITYEYMYSFDVHKNFVKYDGGAKTLMFMRKAETPLQLYAPVHRIFSIMLEKGWDDLCAQNKESFFEGFEFEVGFAVREVFDVSELCPSPVSIASKSKLRRIILGIMKFFRI